MDQQRWDHEMRATMIALADLLDGQAATLRALADLSTREARPALHGRANELNKWATELMRVLELRGEG